MYKCVPSTLMGICQFGFTYIQSYGVYRHQRDLMAVSIKHFPLLMKPMHPISNAMLILVHTNQETFSADIFSFLLPSSLSTNALLYFIWYVGTSFKKMEKV